MRSSLCSLVTLVAFAALGALGSLGACGRDKAPPAPAPGSAAGPGSSAATSAGSAGSTGSGTPAGLELFVNDLSIGTVTPAQLAGWPRLDSMVPGDARKLGTWDLVTLHGAQPTPTELSHPSSKYPDLVPAVFPGDSGAPAFGMFDPVELARKGKPAMREDHLTAIRIKLAQGGSRGQNDDGGGASADPTKLVITIKTPAGETTLTGEKLLSLPREEQPGNPDQKGWRLQALLDAAGVKTYDHLVLSDAAGANLTLDKKDLAAGAVPFIKLNKQGSLRLRVLKKVGDGWNPAGDLRALVAIEAK